MYVTVLARFHGGDREMLLGHAKQVKEIVEAAGAEMFNVVQVHTGPHSGDLVVVVRFPNWEVFGKATEIVYSNSAFQKINTQLAPFFAERNLVTGLI